MSITQELRQTAAAMVAPGRGILAADESVPTITSRFRALGIDSTPDSRRRYRELLFTAPDIDAHVSGVIMHDETFQQADSSGCPFPEVLAARGILPGIKVDTGAKALAFSDDERVTEGLDGLRERIAAYRTLGARFAKWRAVFTIGFQRPSANCIRANAHALARYAAICQEGGVVPIVEPEVLADGDHGLGRCDEVTRHVLDAVFSELRLARVDLAGMVLKPSMVTPGRTCARAAEVEEVARATIACLADTVPASVPGIAFLSGGQAPDVATAHLDAMARLGPHPWQLSFSFGRALQDEALRTWAGDEASVAAAQAVLLRRVQLVGAAALGRYEPASEAA
ncbi:MAG: fructose-bisphosphate aldolase class I [Acidimicrobiia bacterium]